MKRLFVIAACCAIATNAHAVDLTVDQTQPILAPDGKTQRWTCLEPTKPPADPGCLTKEMETIGSLIQDVLVAPLSDQTGRNADPSNAKAGSLAIRLYGKDKLAISIDDLRLIMDRARRIVADPIAIARMEQYLEPAPDEKKP